MYNVTTEIWEDRADMNHARLYHSCTQVSVTSNNFPFIKNMGNDSVPSIMVVGCKKLTLMLVDMKPPAIDGVVTNYFSILVKRDSHTKTRQGSPVGNNPFLS